MEQDAADVVNYLRNRFHREKIFIVGHSWGSTLGLWLAHEHSEWIYAFVGTGQAVSMQENEVAGYRIVLQTARDRHNELAIKELESVAPHPPASPDFNKTNVVRAWESVLLGPPPSASNFTNAKRILITLVSAPEYSLADDIGWIRGQTFSIQTMFPGLMDADLYELGYDFRAPIFFFEGKGDPYCLSDSGLSREDQRSAKRNCVVRKFQPFPVLRREARIYGRTSSQGLAIGEQIVVKKNGGEWADEVADYQDCFRLANRQEVAKMTVSSSPT
jgi:pimeloyl-ACP methyl ester carboxylesterase